MLFLIWISCSVFVGNVFWRGGWLEKCAKLRVLTQTQCSSSVSTPCNDSQYQYLSCTIRQQGHFENTKVINFFMVWKQGPLPNWVYIHVFPKSSHIWYAEILLSLLVLFSIILLPWSTWRHYFAILDHDWRSTCENEWRFEKCVNELIVELCKFFRNKTTPPPHKDLQNSFGKQWRQQYTWNTLTMFFHLNEVWHNALKVKPNFCQNFEIWHSRKLCCHQSSRAIPQDLVIWLWMVQFFFNS